MQTTGYWLGFPQAVTGSLTASDLESGLVGLANVLINVAPLYLMCDPGDIGVRPEVRSPHAREATIFIYDRVPACIGFAEKLYERITLARLNLAWTHRRLRHDDAAVEELRRVARDHPGTPEAREAERFLERQVRPAVPVKSW